MTTTDHEERISQLETQVSESKETITALVALVSKMTNLLANIVTVNHHIIGLTDQVTVATDAQ